MLTVTSVVRLGWETVKLGLEVDGQEYELTPDRTYAVGRGNNADVVIHDPSAKVSRHHLDLRFEGGSWLAEDRSSGGSYAGDDRFERLVLEDGIRIRLGQPGSPTLAVSLPEAIDDSNEGDREQAQSEPVLDADQAIESNVTVPLDDEALRLELDDVHYAFAPGQRVIVGRDEDCDVTTGDRLVSGTHCAFEHDGKSWTMEDLGSTRGTFIDGRRVRSKRKVAGTFTARLGDPNAGAELRVVSKGTYKPKKDRGPLLLAGAALAAVVVGVVAAVIFWPDDDGAEEQIAQLQAQIDAQQQTAEELAQAQADAEAAIAEVNELGGGGNTPAQLSAARLATAFVLVPDENGEIVSTGSGSLVSDDGLILTNVHVVLPGTFFDRTAEPEFSGAFDPGQVVVGFASVDGGPVERFYLAEQVQAHSAHDAALIRVTEGLEGARLSDLPPALPVGESSGLLAGDQIAVVGYPGSAFTQRVSVSVTNFQSFQACEVERNAACSGDYEEGWLNIAGETLTGGSSGGPIIHRGEIVGIQQGALQFGTADDQELGVPIDLVLEEFDIG